MIGRELKSVCAVIFMGGAIYMASINFLLYGLPTYRPIPERSTGPFLTHHLGAGRSFNVESRYNRLPSNPFYEGIEKLYQNREIWLPDDLPLDVSRIEAITGVPVQHRDYEVLQDEFNFRSLLDQATWGFLYNPLSYHRPFLSRYRSRHHPDYAPPWEPGHYPLMVVMLPPSEDPSVDVISLRYEQYLFLLPANHILAKEHAFD